MAKVAFTKLGLKPNQEIKTIEYNGQEIEVKQYLPINEKLMIMGNVINLSHDQNNFSNPVRVDVFSALEIIDAYTNINFTEKQREDPVKIYDLFKGNGLLDAIIKAIPEEDYLELMNGIYRSIDAVYTYHNSILGILEAISTDYENLDLDATKIKEALGDSANMGLLKDVLTKLG